MNSKKDATNSVIIAAQANAIVVDRLIDGAKKILNTQKNAPNLTVVRTPGALEIPMALKKAALSKKFDIFIVLGAVIKGESDHYHHVSRLANDGVQQIALDYGLALGNGILTVHNMEQAFKRADGPNGNLGRDAANAALDLYNLYKRF